MTASSPTSQRGRLGPGAHGEAWRRPASPTQYRLARRGGGAGSLNTSRSRVVTLTSPADALAVQRIYEVALVAVGLALAFALTTALLSIALSVGRAAGPSGHWRQTPVVVPHPSPGPFGS